MSWIMTYCFGYSNVNTLDKGLAAFALSMMGGISMFGTLTSGWWSDKTGGTLPLAIVCLLRGIGFGLLYLGTSNPAFVLSAMAVIGFS